MRGNELLYKMELIDHAYIEAADCEKLKPQSKKNAWLKWGAAAACLCLAVMGTVILGHFMSKNNGGIPIDDASSMIENSQPSANAEITYTEDGVTIPKTEVNLNANDMATADMIGFFIYGGRLYTQYEWFYTDKDIVGEYIGTVTGLIDEWTPQDGYVDFAGSTAGDFYTVKGYDPKFMLCRHDSEGHIETFICDNGITLKYGSELFEDRLHLSENYSALKCETRNSWYYDRDERFELKDSEELISKLIADIDSAEFMLSRGIVSLGDEAYHLFFEQKDDTTIHLRLYENGYVIFHGMFDICVQIPKESYDALIRLIEGQNSSAE